MSALVDREIQTVQPPIRLTRDQRQRTREERSRIHTGVELTQLAARINSLRQVRQEGGVKLSPGELRTQLGRVDARENRPVTCANKLLG